MSCVSIYLEPALTTSSRKQIVQRLVKVIRLTNIQFDAIVFRGFSGSLIAPSVADCLDKECVIVRKEESHSSKPVEGYIAAQRYIIIDDKIVTGDTIRKCIAAVDEFTSQQAVCMGIFLYQSFDIRYCTGVDAPIYGFYKDLDHTNLTLAELLRNNPKIHEDKYCED